MNALDSSQVIILAYDGSRLISFLIGKYYPRVRIEKDNPVGNVEIAAVCKDAKAGRGGKIFPTMLGLLARANPIPSENFTKMTLYASTMDVISVYEGYRFELTPLPSSEESTKPILNQSYDEDLGAYFMTANLSDVVHEVDSRIWNPPDRPMFNFLPRFKTPFE